HEKSINCLSISPDGTMLLSGGDDAKVIIWNLATGERMQEIACIYSGQVAAVAWIKLADDGLAFVQGCADGSLHVHRRDHGAPSLFEFCTLTNGHDGAVDDIDFDPNHGRLATVGGGAPQIWNVSPAGVLTSLVPSPPRKDFVSRNIRFYDNGASVVIFYLESHEIICYTIEPWVLKWSKALPTRIGNISLTPDGQYLVVSNLTHGIDIYTFPALVRSQSLTYTIVNNVPVQVTTASQGSLIICGGGNGFARVFERRTGQLLESLNHSGG
ncbi:WD40 repeat-like protein, partial [Rickenella mellea]